MEPRALKGIVNLPEGERYGVIAEGMQLLVQHVRALSLSSEILRKASQETSAAVLDAFAREEASKVLILLDMARHGWREHENIGRLIANFSNHIGRGVYIEASSMNPGTFSELQRFVQNLLPSHFLDGPNDIDWIFRNRIESEREEALYVDYIKDEDGHRWISPDHKRPGYPGRYQNVETVFAMDNLGLLSELGMQKTSDAWADTQNYSDLGWPDNRSRNHEVLKKLWEASAFKGDTSESDFSFVLERWTFPMGTLNLRKKPVKTRELDLERTSQSQSEDYR
ncbi:AbiV family abortive infection protein [Glaciihabitans sp. dw_435]|uniref:AbiV family abortive infection protein n=1 Tax=Glaciihabitans sp. dw_435 TaxID=2720081 RepID=UPI001BD3F6C8|nr:AbiV family abortive infection protein [Glaciihabitans sp. dw_435]